MPFKNLKISIGPISSPGKISFSDLNSTISSLPSISDFSLCLNACSKLLQQDSKVTLSDDFNLSEVNKKQKQLHIVGIVQISKRYNNLINKVKKVINPKRFFFRLLNWRGIRIPIKLPFSSNYASLRKY